MPRKVMLRELAHSRSGEKGRDSSISVIAYRAADYELLRRTVTVDAVRSRFGAITRGEIQRYEVPAIFALNFVLRDVLEGGRSRTLAFEESGKALSSLMMGLEIEIPDEHPGFSKPMPVYAQAQAPTSGRTVRLGCATAWARDRFEPALDLVKRGELDYLCFDTMSELTMSAAQVARISDSSAPPYDPYLDERFRALLPECQARGIRIVTNQGWLDARAAAQRTGELALELGLAGLKIAAVSGSVITDRIVSSNLTFVETGRPVADSAGDIVSGEVYLGAKGIVEALARGADVVITERVADGCVYLGPLAHEFQWDFANWDAMARGMVVGHLMECGSQVTGGFFADPGYKDVESLETLGNPICEVSDDRIVITKLPGSGGLVSEATCREQLLYEVQDPSRYLCPDVVVDLGKVRFRHVAPDVVEVVVEDAGAPRPPTLKALIGLTEGFMTEEMVLFAGPGALDRAELTKDLLMKRFERIGLRYQDLRMDFVGLNAVHRESSQPSTAEPYEVVLRIALKTADRAEAEKLRREIDPLAVNGVSGTGKWATTSPGSRVRQIVGLNSALISRELVAETVHLISV